MGMRILTFILLLFMFGCSLTVPKEVEVKYEEIPEKVDFNYHVKPILSDRCILAMDLTKNQEEQDLGWIKKRLHL